MNGKRVPSALRRTRKSRSVRNSRPTNWPGRAATEDRWGRMIEKVDEEIRSGRRTLRPPRFLTEEACWKRNVYSFTLANTQSEAESRALKRYTEELILNNEEKRLSRTPLFPTNPFHWVFSALVADYAFIIDRRKIFRFGRHLLYAMQHHVPVEFLIGFLHQVGTPAQVEQKAGSGVTEIWRDQWIARSQAKN